MSPVAEAAVRSEVEEWIMGAVGAADSARPRSQQRHLGPSALGGCREYIRAVVAGEEGLPDDGLKWSAFIGTAVGDFIEFAVKGQHADARTQVPVRYTLPRMGIGLAGSADIVAGRGKVIDLKSKAGLDGVMRDGASFQQYAQISCYLLGLIDAGELDDDAIGVLAFYDRTGAQRQIYTVSVTADEARDYIEAAEDRLQAVVEALEDPTYGDGERHLRDQAEQSCFYLKCPFRDQCWAGYQPTETITDPVLIGAMAQYDAGRELAKSAKRLQDEAKITLGIGEEEPVAGQSEDYSLSWKIRESRGMLTRTIDLRARKR